MSNAIAARPRAKTRLVINRHRSQRFAEQLDEVRQAIATMLRDAELQANALVWAWSQYSTGQTTDLRDCAFVGVARCREQWPDRRRGCDAFRKLESAPAETIDAQYSASQAEDCDRVAWRFEQMPLALRVVAKALIGEDGNVNATAKILGIDRTTVWRRKEAIEKWISDHS